MRKCLAAFLPLLFASLLAYESRPIIYYLAPGDRLLYLSPAHTAVLLYIPPTHPVVLRVHKAVGHARRGLKRYAVPEGTGDPPGLWPREPPVRLWPRWAPTP
jgi:hypothetical protein